MIKKLRYPLIAIMIAVDQLVKYLIRKDMSVGESNDIIGSFFSLTYIQNTGAAFSIMKGEGLFLIIVTSIAMLALIIYLEVNKNGDCLMIVSISMMIGGAVGNMIDRIFLGYVTDMFDFHFWPVFNVADIFVVVGCILLCINVLSSGNDSKEKKEERLN